MSTPLVEPQTNKPHQAPHKRDKSNADINNIRAFSYARGQRARDGVAKQLNIEQIRLDQPETKAVSVDDPPIVVAVQGPPGCGKSLLVKCLVQRYTDQIIAEVKGPITVIANKVTRITFIEVPNDINAMTDAAKIADIVLLVVNAEHNFEMETFEFLNLLMSHGFPKVIGVLTHLDMVDKSVPKALKARFKKELNTQVKVYKIERLHHGKYEKQSIRNLSNYLNPNKIRVIQFRKDRGFVIADRAERSNDNTTYLFGYVRGVGLSTNQVIHIPGAGDYPITSVKALNDPCPLSAPEQTSQRTLKKVQQSVYAPFSEITGLKIEDDGDIYVDIPKFHVNFTEPSPETLNISPEEAEKLKGDIQITKGIEMMREMQKSKVKKNKESFDIFSGVAVEENEEEEKEEEDNEEIPENIEEEEQNEEDEKLGGKEAANVEVNAGIYARFEFKDIPKAFIDNLDPVNPIIIGGLMPEEIEAPSGIQWIKIKRHRFYARKLKSTDPFIISVGWRRFQTLPLYFNEEPDGRLRFMKYTPDNLTCYATYYGPLSSINIGVTIFQHIKEKLAAFRISATGVTIKQPGDGKVVKKLRLTGSPKEIFKRTAKIENMFTSDVEATKFIGASIRTVSKIRGTIKAAEKNGIVRCTFEDTIKPSDIVFLNGWVQVEPEKYFAPIDSLLSDKWNLVRTVAEIRADRDIRPEYKEDSVYKDVERPVYEEKPIKVPTSIKQNLPYKLRKQFEPPPKEKAEILNEDEADLLNMLKKTEEVYKKRKEDQKKKKEAEKAAQDKLAAEEEAIKMHKRTARKQEFFKRNPKKAHR